MLLKEALKKDRNGLESPNRSWRLGDRSTIAGQVRLDALNPKRGWDESGNTGA